MGIYYSINVRSSPGIDYGENIPKNISNPASSPTQGGCEDVCVDTWYIVRLFDETNTFRGYLSNMGAGDVDDPDIESERYMWKLRRDGDKYRLYNYFDSNKDIYDLIELSTTDGQVSNVQYIEEYRLEIMPIVDHGLGYVQSGTKRGNLRDCYQNCCRTDPNSCLSYLDDLSEPEQILFASPLCGSTITDQLDNVMCRRLVRLGDLSKIQAVCKSLYDNVPDEITDAIKDACACHMPEEYYTKIRDSVRDYLDDDLNQFLDRYGSRTESRSCWVEACRESSLNVNPCPTNPLDVDSCWQDLSNPEYSNACTRSRINQYCQSTNDEACIPTSKKKRSGNTNIMIIVTILLIVMLIVLVLSRR